MDAFEEAALLPVVRRPYIEATLISIEIFNADGGPTCWNRLVQLVTWMASDPSVGIVEKLECFKRNGNNIEVRFSVFRNISVLMI